MSYETFWTSWIESTRENAGWPEKDGVRSYGGSPSRTRKVEAIDSLQWLSKGYEGERV